MSSLAWVACCNEYSCSRVMELIAVAATYASTAESGAPHTPRGRHTRPCRGGYTIAALIPTFSPSLARASPSCVYTTWELWQPYTVDAQ